MQGILIGDLYLSCVCRYFSREWPLTAQYCQVAMYVFLKSNHSKSSNTRPVKSKARYVGVIHVVYM